VTYRRRHRATAPNSTGCDRGLRQNPWLLNVEFPRSVLRTQEAEPPLGRKRALGLCCLQCAVDGRLEFAVELEGLVVSEKAKGESWV